MVRKESFALKNDLHMYLSCPNHGGAQKAFCGIYLTEFYSSSLFPWSKYSQLYSHENLWFLVYLCCTTKNLFLKFFSWLLSSVLHIDLSPLPLCLEALSRSSSEEKPDATSCEKGITYLALIILLAL